MKAMLSFPRIRRVVSRLRQWAVSLVTSPSIERRFQSRIPIESKERKKQKKREKMENNENVLKRRLGDETTPEKKRKIDAEG